MQDKTCSKCGQKKPISEYHTKGKNRTQAECKRCWSTRIKTQSAKYYERKHDYTGTKTCCTCKAEKPKAEFHKARHQADGVVSTCKECRSKKATGYVHPKPNLSSTHKTCFVCKANKPRADFYAKRSSKDGLASLCKACQYEKDKRYRQENQAAVKRNTHRWRSKNRGKIRATGAKRYAIMQSLPSTLTDEQWNEIYDTQRGRCAKCKVCFDEHRETPCADHIIPVEKNGWFSVENIQILCRSCNSTKRTKIADYRPAKLRKKYPLFHAQLPFD